MQHAVSHDGIQNIHFNSKESVEVIEVNLAPIIFILFIIVAGVWIAIGASGVRAEKALTEAETQVALTTALERVYAEAQIDALEGRVRVVATESGYEWIESPWNDGRNPRFTDINKYATWNVGE